MKISHIPPDQVVRDFYNWYLEYEGNPLNDQAYQSVSYLSPELVKMLYVASNENIDQNFLVCAPEKPPEIRATAVQISGDVEIVAATTSFVDQDFSVDAIQQDGIWMTDKTHCFPYPALVFYD